MYKTSLFFAAGLIVSSAFAPKAFAAISYSSQTRNISVAAGQPFVSDMASAPDFNLFNQSFAITGTNFDTPDLSHAHASQISDLTEFGVYIVGSVGGNDAEPTAGSGNGIGHSNLIVSFTLDSSMPYSFDGEITNRHESGSNPNTFWKVTLTNSSNTQLIQWNSASGDGPSAQASGTLSADTYTLNEQFVDGWYGSSTGSGTFDFTGSLFVPEPASISTLALIAAIALRRSRSKLL